MPSLRGKEDLRKRSELLVVRLNKSMNYLNSINTLESMKSIKKDYFLCTSIAMEMSLKEALSHQICFCLLVIYLLVLSLSIFSVIEVF